MLLLYFKLPLDMIHMIHIHIQYNMMHIDYLEYK